MFLFYCLLCLSSFLGVMSQTLTQSSSEIKKPGESMKMSCKGTGYQYASYYIHWVQQVPGKGLTWIGYVHPTNNGDTKYSSSFQGRFTLTTDASLTTSYLQIDNLKVEDSATYYCARGDYFDVWGQGTIVTVTSASQSAPSLFPLISCGTSQDLSTTIGCLARNFLPNSIEFSWADKDNSSYSEGFKDFKPVLQSEGTYTASSQVKVNTANWDKNDYFYCTAKHTQGNKTVKIGPNGNVVSRKPIVTIHPPVKDDVEINNNATIACIASGFYPNKIEVSWTKSHNLPLNGVREEAVSDGNGSFTITSYITVPKSDWDTDIIFSCIVKHASSDFHEIKNVSKSTACESPILCGEIKVTVEPPSFETIYLQNTAPLTCIISNMENKDGLEVSWYTDKERLHTEIEDPVYDSATRKFRARAIASVCPEDWRTKAFVCSVSHPELPRVTNVSLSKPNGQDARTPTILLYQPHQDELAKKETATLSCLIKGFSPPDIMVKWIDSDNVEPSNVVTTEPKEEITLSNKKTYFLYSTLTLSVEEWNNGKSYTCIVGHDTLALHTAQKSIDKTSGKATNMNVSLIMSDTC